MGKRKWKRCRDCGEVWESGPELRDVYGPDDECPECGSANIETTYPETWEE